MNTFGNELIDLGSVGSETQGSMAVGVDDVQPSAKYLLGGIVAED